MKKIEKMNSELSDNTPVKFISPKEWRETEEGKSIVKKIWDKMRGKK